MMNVHNGNKHEFSQNFHFNPLPPIIPPSPVSKIIEPRLDVIKYWIHLLGQLCVLQEAELVEDPAQLFPP